MAPTKAELAEENESKNGLKKEIVLSKDMFHQGSIIKSIIENEIIEIDYKDIISQISASKKILS